MTVSIVIPHYGEQKLLDACLDAVAVNTGPPAEIVVVDNGTGHPIETDVVIRNLSNVGFAEACNQGAAAASGDIVVFLNNDTEVQPLWLEPLTGHLDAGAGIVGAQLVYPDGRIAHAGISIYRDQRGVLVAENRRGCYAQALVDAVTGACLAIRRDVFFELGGFNIGYWNGYEDVDLCLKARRAGYRIIYEPASVVTHHESVSGPARWEAVRENVALLQELWADHA